MDGMGGALQAIARSSPARGATMDGRGRREEGDRRQRTRREGGPGKVKGRD